MRWDMRNRFWSLLWWYSNGAVIKIMLTLDIQTSFNSQNPTMLKSIESVVLTGHRLPTLSTTRTTEMDRFTSCHWNYRCRASPHALPRAHYTDDVHSRRRRSSGASRAPRTDCMVFTVLHAWPSPGKQLSPHATSECESHYQYKVHFIPLWSLIEYINWETYIP